MASDAVPSRPHAANTAAPSLVQALTDLRAILRPLASLKIAVTLFSMSIFTILVGTLAQAKMDMWEVMDLYFLNWLSWVEFQVFFPPAWAPDQQDVGGGFWFPGGALIGSALLVNLSAAMLTRFPLQAKGKQLGIGLAALAGAAAFTAVIIISGHNHTGFQGEPMLGWTTLWLVVRLGIGAVALAALIGGIMLPLGGKSRIIEGRLLLVLAAILFPLAIYLFSAQNAYLGDSGMRILWQLIQATLAGITVLLACRILFKKRGTVVTIHLGIALLMFGQFWVAKHDVEEQILLGEGETASFARDIRQTELAIVDRSDPSKDEVVAVPQSLLLASQAKGKHSLYGALAKRDSRLSKDGVIEDESLPFDVQVLEYYENARLVDLDEADSNLATAGTGLKMVAVPVQGSTGTDSDGRVDLAAAYVRVLDEEQQDLGVFMLSQIASSQDVAEEVTVGEKTYDLTLRYRRNYKPYSITLLDVRKDDYLGTATPRNYSSDILLVDNEKNVDRKVHIWMNNPLRFAGETFYQNSYSGPPMVPTESTTIAVVTNSGWMIPYVACMVVVVGLVGHFSGGLMRFLNRRAREVEKQSTAAPVSGLAAAWFPLGIVGSLIILFGLAVRPNADQEGDFRIHQFGRLPVVADGRVKPFDTLARNNLRVISNKYSFRAQLRKAELEEDWPEISEKLQSRWHQLTAEELQERKGDVAAVLELVAEKTDLAGAEDRYRAEEYVDKLTTKRQPAIRWLLDAITDPEVAEQHKVVRIDNLDVLDTLGLSRRKGHLYSINEIRGGIEEYERQLTRAREADVAKLSVYQRKLIELDRRIRTYTRLAASFQPPSLPPLPSREEMTNDETAAMQKLGAFRQAYLSFLRGIESINPPLAVPGEDEEGSERWESYAAAWANAMFDSLGGEAPAPAMAHMNTALVAYQHGDVGTFNTEVEKYERLLQRDPPQELKGASTIAGRFIQQRFDTFYGFEAYFNKVSPFFFCWWPYIAAFVLACLAWLGWSRPLNRAAFWLIAATLLIHTAALIARIYLSGRPPVTNLYSSAVFIGWAAVVAGLLLELIYKNGVGNAVGAALGFASLVIAHNLAGDGDTMTVLQAVLDTQFWLALHVVTVTLGYAATFLAGFLGVIYILRGWCSRSLDANARKDLTRMIYGVLCFALLFSFFGTILGGLWADDSWGRFWGWDPKENGALMIVLWNILVLHCRWDGLVKQRGLAVMAVGGNIVTAWSWFGVNELGVGLHSYGFTEGVLRTLGLFVFSQLGLILLGVLPTAWWLSYRAEVRDLKAT
jgi:ABC-type transport system involved in cytochrome c biogenesis permease subunit